MCLESRDFLLNNTGKQYRQELGDASVVARVLLISLIVPQVNQVVEAQRLRIVKMLLQGKTYGLPGSDGTVGTLIETIGHKAKINLVESLKRSVESTLVRAISNNRQT